MSTLRQQEKRSQASLEDDKSRRSKRGKYTPVACDECKRRKLKCLPGDNNDHCQRCTSDGLGCTYSMPHRRNSRNISVNFEQNSEITALSDDVKQLRAMMGNLIGTVGELQRRLSHNSDRDVRPDATVPPPSTPSVAGSGISASETGLSSANIPQDGVSTGPGHALSPPQELPARPCSVPEQPRFVGPTRSAYGIEIGEQSLTQMGIPRFDIPPTSRPQFPTGPPKQRTTALNEEFWQRCDEAEVVRLISVFQEEVESVYPCLDTEYMVAEAADILTWGRVREDSAQADAPVEVQHLSFKDFQLAKVAIATAIVIEANGRNENSTLMVESVERRVSRILKPKCDLKDLQLLVILSIYYFHCDEDLLAWRTIGIAAREALVMGLHRKGTLLETFEEEKQRALAVRVFWTIYILDRRWSFGTSLSFALVDQDIDAELPEPGSDYQYLQCMLRYGRLCSNLWNPLMSSGSFSNYIPDETTAALDLKTQEWLESIPMHLQLRHPRLGLAARPQPRVLQRLRALLYLRGNHTRTLIYRHHLLSPYRIRSDSRKAWLVVHIAQDSIQVLVHLNATSDIYRRQQNAFNYFLLSALAVIFLAVCHDPGTFAEPCRKPFLEAVTLVRDFSRHSQASHRLWISIRGLLPRLRNLGMRDTEEGHETEPPATNSAGNEENVGGQPGANPRGLPSSDRAQLLGQSSAQVPLYADKLDQEATELAMPPLDVQIVEGNWDAQTDPSATTPNLYQMSNQLMTLFNVFEQGQQFPPNMDQSSLMNDVLFSAGSIIGEEGEISRRFQWLL